MFFTSGVVYGHIVGDPEEPRGIVNTCLTITQIIFGGVALILFVYCIVNRVSSAKKIKEQIIEIDDNQENRDEELKLLKEKMGKLNTRFYLAIAASLLLASSIYII